MNDAFGLTLVQGCFTDFPFSDDTPSHCTGPDVQRYLESFAEHFNLMPRLRLGSGVSHVKRDDGNDRWEVHVDDAAEPLYFDKVVICTGINKVPNVPDLPGEDIFRGERLHSRAFKKSVHALKHLEKDLI
jgi:dimethylaniline monooxygenase (N-oxide forming)